MDLNLLIPIIVVAALVLFVVMSAVRIVPQARRYNVERFGRYRTTLEPGLNFIIPLADRINTKLDVREQVFSSQPKPVITEDNLVVNIDTVLYYQITDPRATIKEAMEKQMRAERDKRAAILHAEGERQSKILTAEGTRQQEILVAQ